MKEKRGFTLIELLAVIVILAIIALIATPIILDMIQKAREKAFINSAYGVLESAEYYKVRKDFGLAYQEKSLKSLVAQEEEKVITLENNEEVTAKKMVNKKETIETIKLPDKEDKLKIKGKTADDGVVYIKEGGSIALAMWSDSLRLCAVKTYDSKEVVLEDREITKEECIAGLSVESDSKSGMTWDGWITLELFYPENSTYRKWRIGDPGDVREEDWKEYEGPITIPLKDVERVYIKYKIGNETIIVPPKGTIYVDIEPTKYEGREGEHVNAIITASKGASVSYKIGSEWLEYTEPIWVEVPGLIEAKAEKEENVYDDEGNVVMTKKLTAHDSVYIRKEGTNTGEGTRNSGRGSGSSGGPTTLTRDSDTGLIIPSYYLAGPNIYVSTVAATDSVSVSLGTAYPARKIYIKVGNGSFEEYEGPIDIEKNTTIYAYYIRESDGMISSTSSRIITNIYTLGNGCNLPLIQISTNPSLNKKYQKSINVSATSDGEQLKYSHDGVVYNNYNKAIKIEENQRLYFKDKNSCGEKVETVDITNIGDSIYTEPPIRKRNINININAKYENNKAKITIEYEKGSTNKYYKIGSGEIIEYKGEFEVTENTTIYAYATSVTGYGEANKVVDGLATGINSPIIKVTPNDVQTNSVNVSIEYAKNAKTKKYRIGNRSLLNYDGPFTVDENVNIYAVNEDNAGHSASATYNIDTIIGQQPIYVIDYGDYYIIKLNYPSSSKEDTREYKFDDYSWTRYKKDGIMLTKPDSNINNDGTIKVKDENGEEKVFNGDFYHIKGEINQVIATIKMRWDTGKPATPEITLNTDEPALQVTASINYDSTSKLKEYKIVKEDGTSTSWLKYGGVITITNNNTTIYARARNEAEVYSEIGTRKITNIDKNPPTIVVSGDLSTTTRTVNLRVVADDDVRVETVKYAKGAKNKSYFKTEGTEIQNNSIVIIEENSTYTFYAVDSLGNDISYQVIVGNIDRTAPELTITDNSSTLGLETTIDIDYGDATTKQYKIGTGSWTNYTGTISLTSYTVLSNNWANSDKTVTVCGKGIDSVGNASIETCKKILSLDVDAPSTPVINSAAGYPVLSENGVYINGDTVIGYDSRKDIDNYYSSDGENWTKYTGAFTQLSGTIYAKSVKKKTGLTISTSMTISTPGDAIPSYIYDGNPGGQYIRNAAVLAVDPSAYGKELCVSAGRFSSYRAYNHFTAFDSNNKELNSVTVDYADMSHGILTIQEGTVKIRFSPLYSADGVVYEIGICEFTNIINSNSTYPTLTATGVVKPVGKITIDYFSSSRQRLYKIGSGEWQEYQDKPIKLTYGQTIYAKGINKYGKETTQAQYTENIAKDAMPLYLYDGNPGGDSIRETAYILVDPSAYGKELCVSAGRVSGTYKAYNHFTALDSNNKELNSVTVDYADMSHGILTIKEGTKKIQFTHLYGSADGRVYEIGVCK